MDQVMYVPLWVPGFKSHCPKSIQKRCECQKIEIRINLLFSIHLALLVCSLRINLLNLLQELRSLEAELYDRQREHRQKEERLQQREKELAAREIDLLERELNFMILQQVETSSHQVQSDQT